MPGNKGLDGPRICRLTDPVGHIDGVEIRCGEEPVYGAEIDVVGIHVIGLGPAEFVDGGVCGGTNTIRLRSDNVVLAVGLVPDGDHVNAALGGHPAGVELRFSLVCKPIPDADRVFGKNQIGRHKGTPDDSNLNRSSGCLRCLRRKRQSE
jgi:hypothetical protein